MKAFEVHLNNRRLCVGGIGEHGVLTAIVDYVVGSNRDEIALSVGGLVTPKEEHVRWVERQKLVLGDEILVKVVEIDTVDNPISIKPADLTAAGERQKDYVREAAKKFGWVIAEGEPPSQR